MTRPNDIPEDVWEKAETAFDLMLCNDIQASGSAEQFRADSIEPHARAILAERERCAAKVDGECERILSLQDGKTEEVDRNLRLIAVVLPELASAIRSGA